MMRRPLGARAARPQDRIDGRRTRRGARLSLAALALACAAVVAWQQRAVGEDAKGGDVTVQLCDNKTTVTVPEQDRPTRESGAAISQALMAQWTRDNPTAAKDWVAEELEKHTLVPPADNSSLVGQGQGATYGQISKEDVLVWNREVVKFAAEGSRVFHSGDELGSTIAVSCDMCHPHAANTHPETYPKFQPQLGRVALLRDMINWCIEHPVRGPVLAADDPKMRALEAYIVAQRRGKTLDYGRR